MSRIVPTTSEGSLLDMLDGPPASFVVWFRRSGRAKWKAVAEAATEREALELVDGPGDKGAKEMVVGEIPERCPSCASVTLATEEPDVAELLLTRFEPKLLLLRDGKPVMPKVKNVAACPHCGRPALLVVKTHRPTGTITVRYKRCRECRATVTSEERTVRVRPPEARAGEKPS
jgi:hypothetical protein